MAAKGNNLESKMIVQYDSKLCEWLINKTPRFRGSYKLLALLMKFFHGKKTATLVCESMKVPLDLTYSTHISIAKKKGHEPQTTKLVKRILSEGDVFFDVGANWGYFSIIGSTKVGKGGLVVAIEANWNTYLRLCQSFNLGGCVNAIAINAAASSSSGERLVVRSPWYRQDTAAYIDKDMGKGRTVVSRTLDDVWRHVGSPPIKLIKVDVEGYEKPVLMGATAILSTGMPFVICEVGENRRRYGYGKKEVVDFMEEFGFRFAYGVDEESLKLGDVKEAGNKNVLFTKRRREELEAVAENP